MPNCKSGDIAVMVSSRIPENIGAFMTVIEAHPQPGWWWVEVMQPAASITGRKLNPGDRARALDSDLHPIRGATSSTQKALDQHTPTHVA